MLSVISFLFIIFSKTLGAAHVHDGVTESTHPHHTIIGNCTPVALQSEDVLEVLQGASPDKATAILLSVTFQPVVAIVVEEQLHVFVCRIIETVLQGDVIKERLIAERIVRKGTIVNITEIIII